MPVRSRDTSPEAEAVRLEVVRRMTPAQRLAVVEELSEAVRQLAYAGLRNRFPGASDAQLRRRYADLALGPELAARAYGPHHPTA